MSQQRYGLGIVGCGTIADTHAEAIVNSQRGRFVAACSRDFSRAEALCNRYGGLAYSDYKAFLSDKDLDVVVICTPSGTHLEFGSAAAEAGKDLIVEKPVEVSLGRGYTLLDRCRGEGVRLAVIYQNRFIPDVIRMKEAVGDGMAGRIFMTDVSVKWFRDQVYYDSGGWRGTLELDGGGAVINQAIHTIDLMLWMCGEVETVHAFTGTFTHSGIEGEDNAVASMKFASGALGLFRASTSVVPPMKRRIELHGDRGTALLDGDRFRMLQSEKDLQDVRGRNGGAGTSSPLAGMDKNHHQKQYDAILEAFADGTDPVVSGEESLNSLALVEAIYTSARSGVSVNIRDQFPNER